MEIIEQYSLHFDCPPKKIRPASRALIVKDGKILLTYEKKTDVYMSPGGGKEQQENFEECCIREIKEESGYDTVIISPFLVINEYCFDTCYEAHYYICEIVGEGETHLTDTEIEHGASAVWVDIKKAIDIFSDYDSKSEDIRSLYMREFTVLNKYLAYDYEKRRSFIRSFLGKKVNIVMDRPKGYVHKKDNYTITYPINYGYIPDVIGGDGEELDVYLLGVNEAVKEYECVVIGIARRHNDIEDKLVAAPEGVFFSKEEIKNEIDFQERYYDTEIEVL